MKLTTLRRVFNKYGKDINIKDKDGVVKTNYPSISYKRPRKVIPSKILDFTSLEAYIDYYDSRIQRGRKDLENSCILCGSEEKIEIHHARKLSKAKKKDYLPTMMAKMNRKQIPVCQKCHIKIRKGTYDGKRIKQPNLPTQH
jgi:hypothetical protein